MSAVRYVCNNLDFTADCDFDTNADFLTWAIRTYRLPLTSDSTVMEAFYSGSWHILCNVLEFVGDREAVEVYRLYRRDGTASAHFIHVVGRGAGCECFCKGCMVQ
jgi:hypothetical protein